MSIDLFPTQLMYVHSCDQHPANQMNPDRVDKTAHYAFISK